MEPTTVTVNGTVYDSRTGLPLRHERGHENAPTQHTAQAIHSQLQRSKTLKRRYVQRDTPVKPTVKQSVSPAANAKRIAIRTPLDISMHRRPKMPAKQIHSSVITKFAQKPQTTHQPGKVANPDVAPTPHAMVQAAAKRAVAQQKPANTAIKPSQIIKQEAIQKALDSAPSKSSKRAHRGKKQPTKARSFLNMATASLAIVLLGGYLTYLNMPSISTRVAAAQAGINASYPSYQPTGYSLSGPVAYQQGQVSMKFAANASPQSYTLTQTPTSWDSSAVLEKAVEPKSDGSYTTSTSGGLTIYRYQNTAVWVNNGILYTIKGDAALSSNQIQNIATSL